MKNSFILYHDQKEVFKNLSDEQAGKLIKAIFEYETTGKMPKELDEFLKIVAIPIKQSLDRNADKYAQKVEKRRQAGKKGGEANASKWKQKEAFATFAKQIEAKEADSDSDSDSDSVNVEVVDTTSIVPPSPSMEIPNQGCFYGEYSNVYLDKQDYGKIFNECLNEKYLSELIEELSKKIAKGDSRYPIYDENFPHAHFLILKSFHKFRRQNPHKFKDKEDLDSIPNSDDIDPIVAQAIKKKLESERQDE